jgi:hypothetical protein
MTTKNVKAGCFLRRAEFLLYLEDVLSLEDWRLLLEL